MTEQIDPRIRIKTNLIDSSFRSLSFTLAGENADEHPQFIEWDRTCSQDGPTFYTDKHLTEAGRDDRPGKKIALLIEPPSLSGQHYSTAWRLRDTFDAILTFNSDFFMLNPKRVRFYPLGGSWIRLEDWGVPLPKKRRVSLITSEKYGAVGHRLRHFVAKNYPEIDRWGRDFRPMKSKTDALAPYRFSIVIESVRINGYFSEKLIDCLSVGTTALYWGAPDIHSWFGTNVIPFENVRHLGELLADLSRIQIAPADRASAMHIARTLRCAEDRIFLHYGDLWNEKKIEPDLPSSLRRDARRAHKRASRKHT